jgi:hypothetical protein
MWGRATGFSDTGAGVDVDQQCDGCVGAKLSDDNMALVSHVSGYLAQMGRRIETLSLCFSRTDIVGPQIIKVIPILGG